MAAHRLWSLWCWSYLHPNWGHSSILRRLQQSDPILINAQDTETSSTVLHQNGRGLINRSEICSDNGDYAYGLCLNEVTTFVMPIWRRGGCLPPNLTQIDFTGKRLGFLKISTLVWVAGTNPIKGNNGVRSHKSYQSHNEITWRNKV